MESQKYQAELIGIAEHWSRTGWRQDFTGSILSERGPNRLHGSSGVVPDGNNTLRNCRKNIEPNTTAMRTCSFTQSNLVVKLTETVLFTSSSKLTFTDGQNRMFTDGKNNMMSESPPYHGAILVHRWRPWLSNALRVRFVQVQRKTSQSTACLSKVQRLCDDSL